MATEPVESVLIVGAGWVGRQIAARMAQKQLHVWLLDRQQGVSEEAIAWMRQLPEAQGAETDDWQSRVAVAPPLSELSADSGRVADLQVDLVIECVPEQLSLKKRVLRQLSETFPPPTLIASNSSYFVPSTLSQFVAHPERFAHMHFHVPVLSDTVADIVGCDASDPTILEQLCGLSKQIGLEPLVLRREHPGYVFNWLLQSVLRSALELAALDVADPADIDKSWRTITGMPLGPFGMMDQIGLDVIEQVLSNARWAEPPSVSTERLMAVLGEHTKQGNCGVKTRRGFYDYAASEP